MRFPFIDDGRTAIARGGEGGGCGRYPIYPPKI